MRKPSTLVVRAGTPAAVTAELLVFGAGVRPPFVLRPVVARLPSAGRRAGALLAIALPRLALVVEAGGPAGSAVQITEVFVRMLGLRGRVYGLARGEGWDPNVTQMRGGDGVEAAKQGSLQQVPEWFSSSE